ncbi:MAG: GAF domain-containing protein [Thermoanaerobaculia bacterium]|nr:GAF domain-containing protein [Thermoanaerobaculia bacterium]
MKLAEPGDQGDKVVEALGQLKSLLDDAGQLAQVLESSAKLVVPRPANASQVEALETRLRAAENDQEELIAQLIEAERQAGKLTSLYVATYQLHVSLDPREVQSAIAEITRDLLGAASFVLLIKEENEGECEVALSFGVDDATSRFADGTYRGGDSLVDATLTDGLLRLEPEPNSEATAVVPLRVEDSIVGALVILRMLGHKSTPLSEDRDILELLAAHAASALFAARVYSRTDRKLKTLQGLVNLIRGT